MARPLVDAMTLVYSACLRVIVFVVVTVATWWDGFSPWFYLKKSRVASVFRSQVDASTQFEWNDYAHKDPWGKLYPMIRGPEVPWMIRHKRGEWAIESGSQTEITYSRTRGMTTDRDLPYDI